MNSKQALGLAALLSLTVACGEGGTDTPGAAQDGELWLLQTRVFSDLSGTMGYVVPTTTLEGAIANDESIEQGGGGMIYAAPGAADGSFLLSYAEDPTLTRYEVSADRKFVKGAVLSFANYGVLSGYGSIAWVDAHTAYWIDSAQLQLIRFDPTTMLVDEALPIPGIEKEGFVTELSGYPIVREDGVFVTARWRKEWEDLEPAAPAGAALVHVDPATDEVTVATDERCTSLLISKLTNSGDIYWFSDNYNAYARIVGGAERGVPDCVLRVRAGEQAFDPDYYLDLAERTGGRPADGVIAGGGSTVWLSVYHEEEVATSVESIDDADVAPAWQWYALDLSRDDDAVINEDRPYASHGAFGWYSSDRSFSSTVNSDYSESILLELGEQGFEERASVEGLLDAIVRVR